MACIKDFQHEDFNRFYEEFQNESDRACALLGAAFLDEQLRAILEAFCVDDRRAMIKLFEGGTAPLGTFSSRISAAYALGFLARTERRDLDLVRGIRNKFAHQLHGLTFESEEIKSQCMKMRYDDFLLKQVGPVGPRTRYVWCVARNANAIGVRRLGIRESRRIVPDEMKQPVVYE